MLNKYIICQKRVNQETIFKVFQISGNNGYEWKEMIENIHHGGKFRKFIYVLTNVKIKM